MPGPEEALVSRETVQEQHLCGGCPACGPTDTKRANSPEELAGDIPPPAPKAIGQTEVIVSGTTSTKAPSAVPVTVTLNQGGGSGNPVYQPGVSVSAMVSEGGDRGYVASPAIDSGPVPNNSTVTAQFAKASASSTATSSQPLSAPTTTNFTSSFTASQPTQSFTASGAAVSAVVQTTSAQGRIEGNADTRQALHRTSSREEPQSPTSVAPRRELDGFAPRRVTGETGVVQRLAPESASRETVRAGTSAAEVRGAPQRYENLAGGRVVQGLPPKERSEVAEQRGEFSKRPEAATKQGSPTLRHEATQEGAIRRVRVQQSDAVPREGTRSQTVRSEGARGDAVQVNTARVDTTRTEPVRTSPARVERFMGWASDRLGSGHTPTARSSESTMLRQQRIELAQPQRSEVATAQVSPVKRGLAVETTIASAQTAAARSPVERRNERATPLSEPVSIPRVRPQPDGASGAQRSPHSMAGVPLSADQRQVPPSSKVASVPQSRVNRSEPSSAERVKQRYDVPVHRRELKESRIQRDPNRGGDRTVERRSSQVRVDSAVKRGESATRGAENRRSTERAAAVPRDNQRSSPRSREALPARSAALRQAIFERINRIVTSAERLRRSNSTALASMQQLELAARIVELLGEEEYEGISELRSRERSGVSAVRVLKRRKTTSSKDQEQYDTRLKSLKALKKQRAARASVQAAAVQSGEAKAGAAGVATQSGAAPGSALGKNVSASRGAPSKTLDIFQAKTDDDTSRDEREGEYSSERSAPSCD